MDKKFLREKQMFELVEQWQNSKQPKKEFCNQNLVNINTFQYWLQKYRKKTKQAGFIPVKLTDSGFDRHQQAIKLKYPNGVTAEVPANTDINILRYLILG